MRLFIAALFITVLAGCATNPQVTNGQSTSYPASIPGCVFGHVVQAGKDLAGSTGCLIPPPAPAQLPAVISVAPVVIHKRMTIEK